MTKKILSLILVFALALFVVACTVVTDTTEPPASGEDPQVTTPPDNGGNMPPPELPSGPRYENPDIDNPRVRETGQTSGDWQFTLYTDNTIAITGFSGEGGIVTVPATIDSRTVRSIGWRAFYRRDDITRVNLPASLTEVYALGFYRMTNLTHVNLDNVQSIGYRAFTGAARLEAISIPSLTEVGTAAFRYAFSVQQLIVPGGLEYMGNAAFSYMVTLRELVIENGLDAIASWAFVGNSMVTTLTIPNSVETIGFGAIARFGLLRTLTVPFTGQSVDSHNSALAFAFGETDVLRTVPDVPSSLHTVTITHPNGLGVNAFRNLSNVRTVNLPSEITSIPNHAFRGSGLSSVNLPNSVASIGTMAFNGASNLTSVSLPTTTTYSVGSAAFIGTPWIATRGTFPVVNGALIGFNAPANFDGNVVIPGNLGIRTIAGAFMDNTAITRVVVPNGVTRITEQSFGRTTALNTIYLPLSLTHIDAFAFDFDSDAYINNRHFAGTEDQWIDLSGGLAGDLPVTIRPEGNMRLIQQLGSFNWNSTP